MLIDDIEIPDEVLDYGEAAVEIYLTSIAQGNTERFAVMCALHCPPGSKGTDAANFEGHHNNPFPNMPPQLAKYYADYFSKRGVNFTGKVYKTGLVRSGYGGLRPDPDALVSDTHEVKKKLESRGWTADGMVSVKGDEGYHEEREYRVADSIVNEHVANEVIENHGGRIKKKDYRDLRKKVKAKLEGK